MKKQKHLVLIVGPTAVGKTELCLELAKTLNSEIFSCDSRQFYKELNIGTAKPSKEELLSVKHHFIDSLKIEATYSVADYEKDVLSKLVDYYKNHNVAILTGGSGLFAKAITHGFDDIPETPKSLREEIKGKLEKEGLDSLKQELKKLDPIFFNEVDLSNKHRIIRALEVSIHTQKPYSFWRQNKSNERPFNIIKIGLERPRSELYDRINLRVDKMLEAGLLEEVKSLENYESHNALQTVGYKEVFAFFNSEISHEKMIELIKRNSRRYAKRQLTWFKNQDTFEWYHPESKNEILNYILKEIKV